VPVGHLADYSGATSDVGLPIRPGVADALAYINKTGGVGGAQMAVETFDYGYQVPRAISQYKKWSGRDKVVAIQGWGTADTESPDTFIAKDEIPISPAPMPGNYRSQWVGRKSTKAAPFNFFYGPSYSDSLRAMLQWADRGLEDEGLRANPNMSIWAPTTLPQRAEGSRRGVGEGVGFEVLPAVQFALTPGDYTAQCLTLKDSWRQLCLSRQYGWLQCLGAAGRATRSAPRSSSWAMSGEWTRTP
jgi:branched-chain amino acid transport system substrate-binding protein